ncbi:MAG: Tim44/TimA family putative adaptor protein [Rhodospirillales bacterium]
MGGIPVDIILFALLAVFLVLRLRSKLGDRSGHEGDPQPGFGRKKADPSDNDNVIALPDRKTEDADPADRLPQGIDDSSPVGAGLTRITIADGNFSADTFLEGAKAAFEMIVGAFAHSDTKTLKPLLSDDLFESFSGAIEARREAGERIEEQVIGINRTEILEAQLNGSVARITVEIESEQVNVTYDKAGEVVDGDPNKVVKLVDIWTFERDLKSSDPTWQLVDTAEPE